MTTTTTTPRRRAPGTKARTVTPEERALRALLDTLASLTASALAEGAGLSLAMLRGMAAPSNRNVPTAAQLRALADAANHMAARLSAAAARTRTAAEASHR